VIFLSRTQLTTDSTFSKLVLAMFFSYFILYDI